MSDCEPQCDCKDDVNRRDFLKIGASAAGLIAGAGSGGRGAMAAEPGYIPPACRKPPVPEWFEQLRQPGGPIVYTGEQLKNIIFPLGGIGTGTMWLSGSGHLVNWQIFNNIQKDSLVDDTFFAVRIEQEGSPPTVRVLRATSAGSVKGIENISFLGQYPFATLQFKDDALPVDVQLEAFNPLVPLDEQSSAIPCAIFTVRVKNTTQKPVKVSILGTLQNAVGHAGVGTSRGVHHPTYGGNINEIVRGSGLTAVAMRAEPGRLARVDPPIELFLDDHYLPLLEETPVKGLTVGTIGVPKSHSKIRSFYWLTQGNLKAIGGVMLGRIAGDVKEGGAFLLLTGAAHSLVDPVRATVPAETVRRETVFAGFDDDKYGRWTPRGEAFSRGPSRGAERRQGAVSGFIGAGLANSHMGNDDVLGNIKSPSFTIKDRYISFLIGGGQHPGKCCMNLIVDGKVIRTETGKNTDRLRRVDWDVTDLLDKNAIIEIVDQHAGTMGHILVDDIRFGNLPTDAVTVAEAKAWNDIAVQLKAAGPTPVSHGKGRAMVATVELETIRPGMDLTRQRDSVLETIARLAGLNYQLASGKPADAPSFGSMCLAMPETQAGATAGWIDAERSLQHFSRSGLLSPPSAPESPSNPAKASPAGQTLNGGIWKSSNIDAGQTAEATFIFAWHFPNQYYPQPKYRPVGNPATPVGNMYTNWFADATAVARHVSTNLAELRRKTEAYRVAMFDTTLPQYLVDAAGANASILRSPTCFWTKAGTFYGFEGCRGKGGGCCPMNCNHVWNYEQTLAKLWPALERNMRVTELTHSQMADGGIHHRVSVPREAPGNQQTAVADGQCGAVLKAYREHLSGNDRRFLADHWASIRKAMDYAITTWDTNADGIMDTAQYNTYDGVIHGQNTFISSLYLAALRAAEEMARLSADETAAGRYRALFDKGRKQIAETLFNGEYYIQITDNLAGGYGKGCLADQVVGQWWARILNLGDVLPVEQVRSALSAIFKHNWLWTQEGFAGTERYKTFASGADKGLLICSWPQGGRPASPIRYRDEAWTGVEYQVAAHKIYEGQVDEGLAIVRGVRERYNGLKKSPWNEIECGDYYARALSAWSLLLAAQGYAYDGPNGRLAFDPQIGADHHRSFFSTAEAWGTFSQKRNGQQQAASLAVSAGRCNLSELRLGLPKDIKSVTGTARIANHSLEAIVTLDKGHARVTFNAPVTMTEGQVLQVELTWQT